MALNTQARQGAMKKFVSKLRGTNIWQAVFSRHTVQLGKAGRFAVFQIKLWSHCARLLKKNRAGQVAAALSYYTIFGIVPLAIVILLLFNSLGAVELGQRVKQLAYDHLKLTDIEYSIQKQDGSSEEVMLTDHLDQIVQKFYGGLDTGSVKFLSGVIVIWAALALLSKIEKTFNNIWHVAKGRGFVHRMINYWSILTLGPLLVGLGVYISAQYKPVGDFQRTILSFSRWGPVMTYYFVAVFVLFWLYFLLPNTKVCASPAIWGACCAGLFWMLARWGFAAYVREFIPYSQVYGVVGLVPLAVFWVFITWLIVLFGLQVTYTTQHLSTLDAADIAAARKTDKRFIANDITVLNVVRMIAEAFEQSDGPLEAEILCGALDLPGEFGQKILDHLVVKGIVVKTAEPSAGYVPARNPGNIKLSEIADAVADVGFAQSMQERGDKLDEIAKSQRTALEKYSVKQILQDEKQETKSSRPKAPAGKRAKAKPASNAGGASVESPAMGLPRPIADSAPDSVPGQTEGPPTGPTML